jgi:glycerophosphoryl diester phosphodiesterase
MDAYRRAVVAGVDIMETDIRRTSDGVLVLYHDAHIAGRRISETAFADLPRLPNGQQMSTLAQLVELGAATGGRTKLLVETKEHGYEREVVELLRSRLRPDQFELMSFNLDSVRALRELAPTSQVGVLFSLVPDWQSGTWPISGAAMVDKARQLGVNFVAIDNLIASSSRVEALARAGFDIAVWTVDRDADLRHWLRDPRVTRLITDRPDRAMQLRDELSPKLSNTILARAAS